MVKFHGTVRRLGAEKLGYHSDVWVEYNAAAYMNDSLFEKYITDHLTINTRSWRPPNSLYTRSNGVS